MAAVPGHIPATPHHDDAEIRPDWIIGVLSVLGLIWLAIVDWVLL